MATAAKGSKPPPSNPPNQTLYVRNLPDKLQKPDLRRELYMLFSTYGPVLDVVALKTSKMRGQAHIVYRDVQVSTQAMRALQGFEFFGHELMIAYAKGKSDTIAKLDGTFRIPTAAQPATTATELQQSIFSGPPAAKLLPPAQPPSNLAVPNGAAAAEAPKSPQGVKRPREDESDEEDVPMEEDDEGEAMEESDDD